MKLKYAFTLIELLVVIAIIGILSGLIIVGMSSSVNSARIAKAQIFSSSLRDSLLASLVSEWKFDQVASNQTPDSWGSNTGSLLDTVSCDATHCPQLQTSGCVYNNCLSFNGTGSYVGLGNVLSVGPATISFWMKTPSNASQEMLTFGATITHTGISIITPDRVLLYLNSSNYQYFNNAGSFYDNQWHHWTLVITGSEINDITNCSLYVDGNSLPKSGSASQGNAPQSWGYFKLGTGGYGNFLGSIDELRLFSQSISASQNKENYYIGLGQLLLNNEISIYVYRQRISELSLLD